ncbi:cytochrome b/b6 domain-containing protein [Primorskyibacter sp. S87]|uniref:cytochrome b/b6 domain-containing protein n=1 Tax=Primorskyibacter sp. S87 TaxID=3415126 RepID=UPI003C7DC7EC
MPPSTRTLSNTFSAYGSVTKTFHWLTVLLIFSVIPLGLVANNLAHHVRDPAITPSEAEIARAAFLFSMHKTLGVTIFFVALARISWALIQPKPGLLNADNKPEAFAAETVHWLLYGSLLLVPLTGWIHHSATTGFAPIWWPFGQSLPFVPKHEPLAETFASLHMIFERVLVVALFLHIAGALKHHVIDRDSTLRRMLPGPSDAPTPQEQKHSLLPLGAAIVAWGVALGIGTGFGMFAPGHSTATSQSATLEAVRSDWQVTEGSLGFKISQMGSEVDGQFADWTAAITFDEPDAPGPAGEVDVTIAITSLTLGSVTQQAMGADFFDAAQFPTASFVAQIEKTESGYIATGPLTLKGQSVPVTLPFDLELDGDTARMTGQTWLQRLDYGIGASLKDESSVGFAVDVSISLSAKRGASAGND